MKIVSIIPARYDSTRFPGKPLADINGKPMIQRVYERTARAHRLDGLIVATDDLRILECVKSFGGQAILTGPDHPSGTDRLAEAADALRLDDEDIVINVQGDEPMVVPDMIHALIKAIEQSADCPMATLAFPCRIKEEFLNPNVVKVVVGRSGNALYFSRSPIPFGRDAFEGDIEFLKHLGFYAYRKSFLKKFTSLEPGTLERIEKLEQLRALEHGYPIRVTLSPVDTVGIDTPEDLQRAAETGILN